MTSPEECAVGIKESMCVKEREGPVAQWLVYRLLIEKVPRSVLSLPINGIVLKNSAPRVHWDRRARKICGVQSPDGACTEENLMQRL